MFDFLSSMYCNYVSFVFMCVYLDVVRVCPISVFYYTSCCIMYVDQLIVYTYYVYY